MEETGRSNREEKNWRPQYHFTASKGWINDPNGLIFFKGWYHLFYQWNPKGCQWGEMHWGHAVSRDMLHWKDLPVALVPDQIYDSHPEGGCFSGSAVEKDGKLYLFYSATCQEKGRMKQTQCMAVSEDGIRFQKYQHNPVIAVPPEGASDDFRDPKVFVHNGIWYMVVGGSVGGALQGGDGRIFLYQSQNLYQWEYCGVILKSNGKMGTMFECPDMFYLNGKWIVTCSPMYHSDYRKAIYCIGEMDFEGCNYKIEKIGNLDYGFDYYAPQSFLDARGNRVLLAWQNGWLWMPWCKDWGPTGVEGWRGALSLPRSITLEDGERLRIYPVKELCQLMVCEKVVENLEILEEKYFIKVTNPKCFYLKLKIEKSNAESMCFEMGIWAKKNKGMRVYVDLLEKIITIDKNNGDLYGAGKMNYCFELQDGVLEMDVFADHSSFELYINRGEGCITTNVYPEVEQTECWLRTNYKRAEIKRVEYGSMKSVWIE